MKSTYGSFDSCKFGLSHYGLNKQAHVDFIYINLSHTVRRIYCPERKPSPLWWCIHFQLEASSIHTTHKQFSSILFENIREHFCLEVCPSVKTPMLTNVLRKTLLILSCDPKQTNKTIKRSATGINGNIVLNTFPVKYSIYSHKHFHE